MADEGSEFMLLFNVDMTSYLNELDNNDMIDAFYDIPFSESVLDNNSSHQVSMIDEFVEARNNDCLTNTSQDSIISSEMMISIPDAQTNSMAIVDDHGSTNLNLTYDLYEETVITQENTDIYEDPFESIEGPMYVIEQPKADQRSRYESDGIRFLPDSRKNPMSIQLPNLTRKSCKENQTYGILLTMVTSTNNPNEETFIHVNEIKYHTEDATQLDNGSIFLPINDIEKKHSKKTFPRLSIICKKYDEYSFDLIKFSDQTIETYEPKVENLSTKTAKGKQFTLDYDLLSYKIIFQLVFKENNQYFSSSIQTFYSKNIRFNLVSNIISLVK